MGVDPTLMHQGEQPARGGVIGERLRAARPPAGGRGVGQRPFGAARRGLAGDAADLMDLAREGEEQPVGGADAHRLFRGRIGLLEQDGRNLAQRDLAGIVDAGGLHRAVAALLEEAVIAGGIAERAAWRGEFADQFLVPQIDHGDRLLGREIIEQREAAIVGQGGETDERHAIEEFRRDDDLVARGQGLGVIERDHVGALAARTARIEGGGHGDALAVGGLHHHQMAVAAADHAQHRPAVAVDQIGAAVGQARQGLVVHPHPMRLELRRQLGPRQFLGLQVGPRRSGESGKGGDGKDRTIRHDSLSSAWPDKR